VSRAFVLLARDDVDAAVTDVQVAMPLARLASDPQNLVPALSGSARVLLEAEKLEEARVVAEETLAHEPVGHAAELAWVADALELTDRVSAWLQPRLHTWWKDAAEAVLRRDFGAAADLYHEIGDGADEARARLHAAERLVVGGDRAEAERQLELSLGFWRSVGATRYARQAEAVLAAAT
jgi:hypothetical protein